jgi:predicted permease
MLAVLIVILPIFALVLAGWVARRSGVLGPNATGELNRFVVYLALPALLFDIVANAHWREIWQPTFIAVYGLGIAVVFVLALLLRWRRPRHLADAAIDGLNAAYANNGFVGFPLALAVLGPDGLAPTLITAILTVCVLFGAGLVVIEIGLQAEQHPARMVGKIARSLARNPLLIAPAAGAVLLGFGIRVPLPLESFLKLLGAAASPCALVALGLFLAERRDGPAPAPGAVTLLVVLKLVAQPAVTWVLATYVFHLPARLTHVAVLMAALPTGTGPFMVAEYYAREAALTGRVVLASTIASLATVTLYLSWAG